MGSGMNGVEAEANQASVLQATQREMGAEFGLFAGREMARHYSGEVEEHLAVRKGTGLIDLSNCGSIRVWGGEAVQFLNGLVSNDVKTLAEGQGMRAALLTGHGKIRALCRILNLGQEFLIINDPQTHEKVFKYVSPFCYAGDFKVEDVSMQYRLLSVQGPSSHLVMKEVCFEPVPELAKNNWFRTLIAGHPALVVKASHTGEPGYDVLVSDAALKDTWDFILLKGRFHSMVPFGFQALNSLRIEAAIPIYGVDVDETNMLLEAGLEDVVSFTKGCYTGQEAVAMATYRGHVSKKLAGLAIRSPNVPPHGDVVKKDGKSIGLVASALLSPSISAVIALAQVKYGFYDVGTAVDIESTLGSLSAEIVELPFYRGV